MAYGANASLFKAAYGKIDYLLKGGYLCGNL